MTVAPTGTDARPGVMAINRKANMVYASDEGGQYLTALDGATLKVTNTPVDDTNYQSMAVNETTNKVYASDLYNYRVTVFDSQANLLGDVRDFNNPADLAVNEATNKIYVLDSGAAESGSLTGRTLRRSSPPVTRQTQGLSGSGTSTTSRLAARWYPSSRLQAAHYRPASLCNH